MLGWMKQEPWWAAAAVCVIAGCLLVVGAVTHLADLVQSGLIPYAWAPGLLNVYWATLTVLDPLAAIMLLQGRRRGAALACAVVVTDVAANAYAAYGPLHSTWSDEPGLQRLTTFALFTLVVVPPLWKHLPK